MLIYCGIKFVGIALTVFAPNYATFAIGRFLIAHFIGCAISGYVLGNNTAMYLLTLYIAYLLLL